MYKKYSFHEHKPGLLHSPDTLLASLVHIYIYHVSKVHYVMYLACLLWLSAIKHTKHISIISSLGLLEQNIISVFPINGKLEYMYISV
jgi:hypothetical protein